MNFVITSPKTPNENTIRPRAIPGKTPEFEFPNSLIGREQFPVRQIPFPYSAQKNSVFHCVGNFAANHWNHV